ncbi:uncharacterized protein LOC121736323 isoform X2 [Aricia agestis]|uniref:uncharacterized protein LOC121736323 isoform X2 n=2 Tax=Aricia agestis TaxID=91739 RepID=UPI001C208C66|nr:uncharacterized protein LOC121736323 isoform X2 [Aricia agestis]
MATNDTVSGIKPPASLQIDSDKSTSWKKWLQQFEWYAIAIQLDKKPAEVQAATFMAVIGPDAIEIYNSFNLSDANKNNLKIIKERFGEYFTPKTNISFERYIFFKIEQNEDEHFNEFLTRIKTQASKCEFDNLLDEMLKDKIVFGIRSNQIREKLLTEDKLNLTKAIAICKTCEEATKQLDEFEGKNKVLSLKNKSLRNKQNEYFDCKRCGTNHKSRECPAFNKPCAKCNKNGHFAKMCHTQKKYQIKQKNRVNAVEESSISSEDEVYISAINAGGNKDWTEKIQVGNVQFTAKLDTGAQCNVLPRHLIDKIKAKLKPSRTKNLISYTEDRLAVLGEVELLCTIKNEESNITFKVVQEKVIPILGLDTCEKLELIARVKTLKESECEDDVFNGLGCYKDYEYDIDLIENPKLEIIPPRRIPHAIRDEVKQELDRMVKLDVIKPQKEPTPAKMD